MTDSIKFDNKDKLILKELYIDGRMPISKLAKKTKIQRDTIKNRINNMKKRGIIKSIMPSLNLENIGFPVLYKIDINLQNYNPKIEDSFIHYLKEHDNVIYLDNITGKFDLTVMIAAKNASEFANILKEIRNKYPEVIRDHEIATINKIYKFWDYTKLFK